MLRTVEPLFCIPLFHPVSTPTKPVWLYVSNIIPFGSHLALKSHDNFDSLPSQFGARLVLTHQLRCSYSIILLKCLPQPLLSFRGQTSLKTTLSGAPPLPLSAARPPQCQGQEHRLLPFQPPPMSPNSKWAYGVFSQQLTRSLENASLCGHLTRGMRK